MIRYVLRGAYPKPPGLLRRPWGFLFSPRLRASSRATKIKIPAPAKLRRGLCAQDWIRTSTPLRALRPEHSASTNFATWAAVQQRLFVEKPSFLFRECKVKEKILSHQISLACRVCQPIINTPVITSTVPAICSLKMGSPNIKCACRIVDTGPTLVRMEALLEPIFLIP